MSRASNLPAAELPRAVDRIHRHGARAYLALNTPVLPSDLAALEELARAGGSAGVDAIILQERAVALIVRALASGLLLHASTQMTVAHPAATPLIRELGIMRVVLPRELSIEETAAFRAASHLETEVFVHGALRVSSSGQCFLSEARPWPAREAGLHATIAGLRIEKPREESLARRIPMLDPDALLVRHWTDLARPASTPRHGDFSLSVANPPTASLDIDLAGLELLLRAIDPSRIVILLHHHMAAFHTEHCIDSHLLSAGREHRTCGRPCEQHQIGLEDPAARIHLVLVYSGCCNTVFTAGPRARLAPIRAHQNLFVGRMDGARCVRASARSRAWDSGTGPRCRSDSNPPSDPEKTDPGPRIPCMAFPGTQVRIAARARLRVCSRGAHPSMRGPASPLDPENPAMSKTPSPRWPALLLLAASLCPAQTTWTGASSNLWASAANWTAGVPGPGTDALIPNGAPVYPLVSGTVSCLNLQVAGLATITIPAGQNLDVYGNLDLQGRFLQNGNVRLRGAGAVVMALGRSFPNVVVDATGLYTMDSLYILGNFTLLNGIARFIGPGSNILGQCQFLGGELQGPPGTISPVACHQDVLFQGCTVTTNPALRVSGDWNSDALFQPTGGAVALDGAGVRTVQAPLSTFFVFGILQPTTLDSVGGPVSFTRGYISFGSATPTTVIRATGANPILVDQLGTPIPNLIVDCTGSCLVQGQVDVAGFLSLVNGTLLLDAPSQLTVSGTASLSGGSLQAIVPLAAGLFLDGPAQFTGTSVGVAAPIILSRGSFLANAAYQPQAGFTIFHQMGVQTLNLAGAVINHVGIPSFTQVDLMGGAMDVSGFVQVDGSFAPGSRLRYVGTNQPIVTTGTDLPESEVAGTAFLSMPVTFGGSLRVLAGAALDVGSSTLGVNGSAFEVHGTCTVASGGAIALASGTAGTVSTTGQLDLHGSVAQFAALQASGAPGYSFTCHGTISAQNFRIAGSGSGGFVLGPTATLAAAPFDFRAGRFEGGSGGPGSVLLHIQRTAATTIRYADFPVAGAAANVTATASGAVTFVNWTGAFAGPAFENDPQGLIDWAAPQTTQLASFAAIPGREQVNVAFTTSAEVDAVQFLLEQGPAPGGPFVQIASFTPLGPGNYGHLDAPLIGNQTYHYRLREVLSHGPLRVLATASACPWPATLPPSIRTVGPGGAFADIQAALASVTNSDLAVIRVAAGTYPSFTITDIPGVDLHIHIVPEGNGPVTIDTTLGPLTIQGPNNYFDRIRISGLNIGSTLSTHPGIAILGSDPSVVVLDSLTVTGGAGQPAILIQSSTHIALQDVSASGSPDMRITGLSVVTQARGQFASVVIQDPGSYFRRCGASGSVNVAPGSTFDDYRGIMPGVALANFAQPGTNLATGLSGRPASQWLLAASLHVDWFDDINLNIRMVGLLLLQGQNSLLAQGTFDVTGTAALLLPIPADKNLVGLSVSLQFMDYDPVGNDLRWSTQDTVILMP
jgi:hypothetical protein